MGGMPVSEKQAGSLVAANLVSDIAVRVLARNPGRLAEEFAEAVPSVVLCADLSGFSVAGARLIQTSERGAEELRGIVNAVFERVIDAIEAHGGRTLQFAGDAVIAAWPIRRWHLRLRRRGDLGRSCHPGSLPGARHRRARRSGCARPSPTDRSGSRIFRPRVGSGDLVICGDVFKSFRSTGAGLQGRGARRAGSLCLVCPRH